MNEKKLGMVKETFSADINSSGLPRPIVNQLVLLEGHGIEHDKFANDDLNKTVMIIGEKSYLIAKENGIELVNGSYGENILFDFDPHELEINDIIKIGDTVVEITQTCTLCDHLSIFGANLPKLIKNHRGLYCKIIKGGTITKGLSVLRESV